MNESSTKDLNASGAYGPGAEIDFAKILTDAARDHREDPDFRARLEADPRAELEARGMPVWPEDVAMELHVDTPDVFHLVMAADPNAAVSDQNLSVIAGGSTASTGGSLGSVSTVGSFPSCVGSGMSVSSAGTGGSATGD